MTRTWSSEQITIAHLAIRYRGADLSPSALRLRTERSLRGLDLHPRGLPPGAVLLVRELHSPEPLTLATLGQTARTVWTDRLRDQLSTLAASAARPASGSVAGDAVCVLFADPAELLACLTRDLLARRAWQQWYWRQFLRAVSPLPGPALAGLWCEQARFLPAALALLPAETVLAAIALLSPAEVNSVIAALSESFALSQLASLPAFAGTFPDGEPGSAPVQASASTSWPVLDVPPWSRWLLPASRLSFIMLPPQVHYLYGLAATLAVAPAVARSTAFAVAARAWLIAESARFQASSVAQPQRGRLSGQVAHPLHRLSRREVDATGQPSNEAHALEDAAGVSELLQPPGGRSALANTVILGKQTLPSDSVSTELAGVFYLINVLAWPDLSDMWNAAASHAEPLSGWAIVEALARVLLGSLYHRYRADPLWGLLAALDGREAGHLGPRQAEETGLHALSWQDERSIADPSASEDSPADLALDQPLIQWPAQTLAGVHARLVQMLGLPAAQPGASTQLAELLLCQPGRVQVSRTHVDLSLPMDEIRLPVRRAGLDRDPGWVPDLGRIVLLHFI